MKLDFILPEVDKVSVPSENEVQGQLRRALLRLGPNGEHWAKGKCRVEDNFCSEGALATEIYGDPDYDGLTNDKAWKFLESASHRISGSQPFRLNDKAARFSEVRTMFELAITLAGEQ